MKRSGTLYCGRPSWWSQAGSFAALAILILMPFIETGMAPILIVFNVLLSCVVLGAILFSRYGREYTIADGLITSRRGILRTREKSLRIRDVRKIDLKQTAFRRLVDIGDVEFSTGGSRCVVTFEGIAAPGRLIEQMQQRKRKPRKRR